jgi:DNA gyrase/topoisomerase IV subunit A
MAADASAVACVSANGRLLVFGLDEMKTLSSGGRGVNLMELERTRSWLPPRPSARRVSWSMAPAT